MLRLRRAVKVDNPERALIDMIDRTQARITFSPQGDILWANKNFCAVMDYDLEDIKGKHHSMFCDPEYAASPEYAEFWERLRGGESFSGNFPRLARSGRIVWILATYAPVYHEDGTLSGVVKLARDITANKIAEEKIGQALQALAEHDLATRLDLPQDSDFAVLVKPFNAAMAELQSAMRRTAKTVDYLNDEVSEDSNLAIASAEQAQKERDQCAATSQTIAQTSLSLTATAQQIRENANRIEHGVGIAQNCSQSMVSATDAVRSMQERAQAMAEINLMIESVSFQTTLLALNAGVEAARAGEAGGGFSVVASEIRALANRSAQASQDIATKIAEMTSQVSGIVEHISASTEHIETLYANLEIINKGVSKAATETEAQCQKLDFCENDVQALAESLANKADIASRQSQNSKKRLEQLRLVGDDLRGWSVEDAPVTLNASVA